MFVRSFTVRYSFPVAMASNTVNSWIAARHKDIERAFNHKEIWNALDEIIQDHSYCFKSIAAWPLDACVVDFGQLASRVQLEKEIEKVYR